MATGELDVKTAHLPGLDAFAMKIGAGFLDNPKLGLRARLRPKALTLGRPGEFAYIWARDAEKAAT